MKVLRETTTAILAMILIANSVLAQNAPEIPEEVTLFKNVNIFDGTTQQLKDGLDVLVVQNKTKKIAADIPTFATYISYQ